MHTSGRSYFEAERFIKSKAAEISLDDQINKKLKKQEDYTPFDELMIKRLNIQAIESPRAVNYYSYRKITKGSIEKFQLGYSEKQDMITIPVHAPDGMLLGFVGRSVEGKTFKNTPGLPKSKTLFNIHRVKAEDKVYVVESSFDAIRLDQVGMPAVATLGANVSNFQIELLQKYFNNIYVIADNDEAGDSMAKRVQDRSSLPVSIIKLNKQYKDIGDMPDDEIKNLDISFDSTIASMLK
jgi:DNA primase